MGLDMYLVKKTYVKNWKHNEKNGTPEWEVSVKNYGKEYPSIKPERIMYVEEEVMYWRKANQIHKWFVENVQEGNDDCGTYFVEREKLRELLDACKTILDNVKLVEGEVVNGYSSVNGGEVKANIEQGKVCDNPELCEEILPASSGFFFGGTDYDQWYYQDIENTYNELSKILKEEGGGDFYYSSSW
jgi:hypothetical protein